MKDANDLKQHAESKQHKEASERSLNASGSCGGIVSGMQGLAKRTEQGTLEAVHAMLWCAIWLVGEGLSGSKIASLLAIVLWA